jgi:phosphoribosylamine---glycine ligase
MNILLLGSGGRENALAWKMQQSHHCSQLFIAPGNPGTIAYGTNVVLDMLDFESVKQFCITNNIQLLVVGPEEPLVKGIYDYLKKDNELGNMIIVAPSAAASQLEGSKAFAKQFMQKNNIPTAKYGEFTIDNYNDGLTYLQQHSLPIVLKADGLAAGKGVVICVNHSDAVKAFEEMIINKQFGNASSKVVVEEFLQGIEVSVFVLTNGIDYQIIGHAKDYKQVGEGNTGLNTGGMGCVSPVPFMDDVFMQKVDDRIIKPTIKGLQNDELCYNGFVFLGLMNCNEEPFVIEYNCRLGDPETEVILPRLETDLVSLFAAMDNGTLIDANIEYNEGFFATIMAVSGGYPEQYKTNINITGIGELKLDKTSFIFQAGTKIDAENNLVTNGGRVLAVTSQGNAMNTAVDNCKEILAQINFDGMYYRPDIGFEFK